VMVVASGSGPRGKRLNLGHFAAGRWQLTSPDQPTDRAEVLVSGEGLQRGPVDVLGTLLHEAAHGLAYARKVSDTSRQGRYHNRRYATLARELGLDVAYRDPIGWSATSVPDPATARYAETLTELTEALVLWRRAEQASPVGPRRSRNALACSCDCGRRIRVARSVLELAPILCAGCAQPFEPRMTLPVDAHVSTLPAIYRTGWSWGAAGGWVLAWKQPRAVDAGKRGLGQPARHNASAATVQPEAAGGRIATGSDHQSRQACVPVGGRGWQGYSYARCSGSISWPPGWW